MALNQGTNFDIAKGEVYLKETFADVVTDMVPETDRLAKLLPFKQEKTQGKGFRQPVTLGREMGATFNTDGSAFQLNKPKSRRADDALVTSTEFVLRSVMSYAMITRALSGEGEKEGRHAWINTTKSTFEAMAKGASFFREATLMYGGGPGASSALATVVNTTGSSGTSLVMKVAKSDWATALWAGSEGGEFDAYNGATKLNTNGTAGNTDSIFELTSVDVPNTTLTFTSAAANVAAVVAAGAGVQIFFAGARTKETLGLVGACQTTSGNLWDIPVSNALWKPQTTNLGGTSLTFEAFMEAQEKLADIGFTGTMNYLVSPATWTDLANDQAALVRHNDKAGGRVEVGFEEVSYYSQTGRVNVKPYIYMKRGMVLGLPEGYMSRVGSTDTTFKMNSYGKLLRELDNQAGIEARLYWDQGPYCECPAYMQLITGITNTSDNA